MRGQCNICSIWVSVKESIVFVKVLLLLGLAVILLFSNFIETVKLKGILVILSGFLHNANFKE